MRHFTRLFPAAGPTAVLAVALVIVLTLPCFAAETLDEVITRHVAAHGGRDRWQAVESLSFTGTYTAFSIPQPFTMHKKRSGRYYFDHKQNEKSVLLGDDGETAWWSNQWYAGWPSKMPAGVVSLLRRESPLTTPLFRHGDGVTMELVGPTDLDGEAAIHLTATYADGVVESWYLNPETYLEMASIGPGVDFTTPVEQSTFFADFRTVDGLVLPHLIETQFSIRDRVMVIEHLAVNAEIDDALFSMPPPTGMERLQHLVGEWQVTVAVRSLHHPEAGWKEHQTTSSISSLSSRGLLQERMSYSTLRGIQVERVLQWSYDRFGECYRVTEFDDYTSHVGVLQGMFDEENRLTLETASYQAFGRSVRDRYVVSGLTADGFTLDRYTSTDDGKTWVQPSRFTYTRSQDD